MITNAYKKKKKCILFDLDGTLIDSIPLIRESFRFAVKKVLGKELPDDVLLANVGRPLEIQMRLIDPEKADELLRVYREHNHKHHDECVRPVEGIKELLEELKKRGIRIGVVTSKSGWLSERGIKVCGLDAYIDAIIAADHVEKPKPHPEPIERCLEILGCGRDESVYVGDSPFDIESGRKASVTTIAVPFGPFSRDKLVAAGPDYIADTVDELRKILKKLIA
jgi:pyrophosphatase PpaX